MERAYLRLMQAKDKLASALDVPSDVANARMLAGQIARQVAAAAQEYVSLGGRSSALLEPQLPVTNSGKPIPIGDTGFRAYEAATSAVKAAANEPLQEAKTAEPSSPSPEPKPMTQTNEAKPSAAAGPAPAPTPAPQTTALPEFAGGLSLRV